MKLWSGTNHDRSFNLVVRLISSFFIYYRITEYQREILQKEFNYLFVCFSGRRPLTSRGCCTSPDQMQASRCRSRVRPALRRPPRARNTRRDVTRTLGIKLVTSPIPIRWRGKTRLQFHPCHPWRCPLRLRRLARRIKELEHSRSGNDGNWFPARPRTGRDTSEYPCGRSNRTSKDLDESFSFRTRFKTVLLKVERTIKVSHWF